MIEPLARVFNSNAQCIASSVTAGTNTSQIPTLTASQFISLLRKKGLIDSQLTEEKVNSCFDEAKFKNDLQINYEQFLDLIQLIARVIYPNLSYDASFGVLEHALALTTGEKKYTTVRERTTSIPRKTVIKPSKQAKSRTARKLPLNV